MFSDLLLQVAEVHARSGRTDRFGQPVDQNPSQMGAVTSTFPCRVSDGRGGRTNEERSLDVFEVLYDCYAGIEAEVNEDDTVVVKGADGTVLVPAAKVKVKETKFDAYGPHHLELVLSVQRGPL